MSKEIEALQKELDRKKAIELKNKWEVYLDKIKKFCDVLKGKIIVAHTSNGAFIMYKVSGYKEQYYMDREGAYGQWSPARWIEIQTEGYLSFSVADSNGRWFNPSITSLRRSYFDFIVNKKGKLQISEIDFTENSLFDSCLSTEKALVVVGKTEYFEYREDPNYDRAISNMLTFSQIMDDTSVYDEAYKIHLDHVQKVKNFWVENKPKFDNLKRLSDLFPK